MKYLRYIIKNEEPIRIADAATSQSGQTDSIRYITGSTIQGYIVSSLSGRKDFEEIKKALFSAEMVYTNAYPTTGARPLFPSPKGFYEDKTIVKGEKEIQNVVVNGDFSDGMKRASLGSYAYIEDGCVHYYNLKMRSAMKIIVNPGNGQEKSIFRNEMITAGQYFEGYIRLGSDSVNHLITELMGEGQRIRLGNARTSGMGGCRVIKTEVVEDLSSLFRGFCAESSCYMMLLSDTTMRNDTGEICGLDLESLEKIFGVEKLRVAYAATSVREVHGYNRTWRTHLPVTKMYEAGSIFHFTYEGTLRPDRMEKIFDEGVGVRRTEGFGRVTFLKDYEQVNRKFPEVYAYTEEEADANARRLSVEEQSVLKIAAKNYYRNQLKREFIKYIINNPLKREGFSNSKIGAIEAVILRNRYDYSSARKGLKDFFDHEGEKERGIRIQKERASIAPLEKQIEGILDDPLIETLISSKGEDTALSKREIMGMQIKDFYTDKDEETDKLQLLIRMIRYDRK